jgi:2-polyprenyl-3-methyl-5-hydroxy-6-metoxy-1,4-benzoquinol methylase
MPSKKELRSSVSYFNRVADSWGNAYAEPTAGGHALRERRRRLLELLEGAAGSLLDAGCGPGLLAAEVEARGWRYTGVDAAKAMLASGDTAARRGGQLAAADVQALPFATGSFDAVVCIGVLDHVVEQQACLAEFLRVVRPGGLVVASFPNSHSPYAQWTTTVVRPLLKVVRARSSAPTALPTTAILRSPAAACALFEEAGARVTGVVHYHHNVMLTPLDELLPTTTARLAARFERLHKTRWSFLGIGFLVAGRRP